MSLPLNLYTASQVRELDRIAIEEFGIPGYTLMQRAGQVTFDILQKSFPATESICVVCGTGNNGGDGYVIARLAVQAGLHVSLVQLGDSQSINGDALLARNAYLKTGATDSVFDESLLDADIVIDAIFGTGLTREVTGEWSHVIGAINYCKARVIAVDIPSGLNSDTGVVLGCCVKADKTVTYIGLKSGLFTGQARDYVGQLEFDDLKIPADVYGHLASKSARELIPEQIIQQKLEPRPRCSHKGNFGHALFIGGAPGMSGAIRLAAEAGLRTGTGLVTVATHPSHAAWLNLGRPELMVTAVERAEELLPLIEKASVIAMGPGLGQSGWARDLFSYISEFDIPKVMDADALNLLSLSARKEKNWILTPHPAEAARLLFANDFDVNANQFNSKRFNTTLVEQDRYKSVAALQQKYGGVCVLKGAGTLVADREKIAVCPVGNPGMSSAGMGDVLTGVIAGLVAQGLSLSDAANTGTYLHATAADLAAQKGERGLLASDLFPYLQLLVNGKAMNN